MNELALVAVEAGASRGEIAAHGRRLAAHHIGDSVADFNTAGGIHNSTTTSRNDKYGYSIVDNDGLCVVVIIELVSFATPALCLLTRHLLFHPLKDLHTDVCVYFFVFYTSFLSRLNVGDAHGMTLPQRTSH